MSRPGGPPQPGTAPAAPPAPPPVHRVITYIDEFNLFFGMRQNGWRRYYWFDVHQFPDQVVKADGFVLRRPAAWR